MYYRISWNLSGMHFLYDGIVQNLHITLVSLFLLKLKSHIIIWTESKSLKILFFENLVAFLIHMFIIHLTNICQSFSHTHFIIIICSNNSWNYNNSLILMHYIFCWRFIFNWIIMRLWNAQALIQSDVRFVLREYELC